MLYCYDLFCLEGGTENASKTLEKNKKPKRPNTQTQNSNDSSLIHILENNFCLFGFGFGFDAAFLDVRYLPTGEMIGFQNKCDKQPRSAGGQKNYQSNSRKFSVFWIILSFVSLIGVMYLLMVMIVVVVELCVWWFQR